jgi:hypothetical protein
MTSDEIAILAGVGYPTDSNLYLLLPFRACVFASILTCVQKRRFGQNLTPGNERRGFCKGSAVEDQCYTVFQRNITAPNREVAMAAMRRKLAWVETQNFQGWICTECAWAFNPLGPVVGESIDEMKTHYEQQRDQEFTSHVCAEHPRATKNPR